jgi:hypothetical protein
VAYQGGITVYSKPSVECSDTPVKVLKISFCFCKEKRNKIMIGSRCHSFTVLLSAVCCLLCFDFLEDRLFRHPQTCPLQRRDSFNNQQYILTKSGLPHHKLPLGGHLG